MMVLLLPLPLYYFLLAFATLEAAAIVVVVGSDRKIRDRMVNVVKSFLFHDSQVLELFTFKKSLSSAP